MHCALDTLLKQKNVCVAFNHTLCNSNADVVKYKRNVGGLQEENENWKVFKCNLVGRYAESIKWPNPQQRDAPSGA